MEVNKITGSAMLGAGFAMWAYVKFVGLNWPRSVVVLVLIVLCWGGVALLGSDGVERNS